MPNYTLANLTAATTFEPNKIYLGPVLSASAAATAAVIPNQLRYKILQEDGSIAEGIIRSSDLGVDIATLDISSITALEPYLPNIIDAASAAGHVVVEASTLLAENVYGSDVQVGVNVGAFEDPKDADYVYICPDIYVRAEPAEPRHLVMLVDVSGSMEGLGLDAIKRTLPQLFARLNPHDKITLTTFSNTTKELITGETKAALSVSTSGGAGGATRFAEIVDALKVEGGTALRKAILSVADKKDILASGHTTVLLFTDGEDTSLKEQASVAALIAEYNVRFEGKAPRILPIGLGSHYDHKFIKALAIATNFGLVDARNQARLNEHTGVMAEALAHGIPMNIQIGSVHCPLGTVNYNTANKQTPIRVPKTALSAGLTVNVDGKKHTIAPALFKAMSPEQRKQRLQSYLIQEGKRIYDLSETEMTFTQKMDAIEALIAAHAAILNEETRTQLKTLLLVLDKKALNAKGMSLVNVGRGDLSITEVLERAVADGTLKPRYPENNAYVREAIAKLATGPVVAFSLTASIARGPVATAITETTVEDAHAADRFTGTSSLTSSVFRANLSLPGVYRAAPTSAVITLDRTVDFSKLTADQTVVSKFHIVSVFNDRENVRLRMGASFLEEAATEIRGSSAALESTDVLLARVIAHVRTKMPNSDLSRIGITEELSRSEVDIEECLREGTGVCRHLSLYTAGLLGKLASSFEDTVKVTHYRAVDNSLRAHSMALLTQTKSNGSITYFIVDPTLNICEKIASQADFERCVEVYNSKGLHWFLRNFAKDHHFSYPASEDAKSIGMFPILQLQLLAFRDPSVMTELRELNVIPTGTSTIVETAENRKVLWERLVHFGCIVPEEVTEEQVMAASDKVTSEIAALSVKPRATFAARSGATPAEAITRLKAILVPYLDDTNPHANVSLRAAARQLVTDIEQAEKVRATNPSLYKEQCQQAISTAELSFKAHRGNTFWQKHIVPWVNWLFSCFPSFRVEHQKDREVTSALQQLSLFKNAIAAPRGVVSASSSEEITAAAGAAAGAVKV